MDDDTAVQATIRLLQERAGHNVVTAGDGRKGIALFGTGDFDLLFLDIFMPGMDGFETMRLVHQRKPRIPIIVISGKPIPSDSGPNFLTMAMKLGAITGLRASRERCCVRPAMRNSIQFNRPARRAEWEGVRTPK